MGLVENHRDLAHGNFMLCMELYAWKNLGSRYIVATVYGVDFSRHPCVVDYSLGGLSGFLSSDLWIFWFSCSTR